MDLPTLWFVIMGYLFAGFFFLEGFDYGVGILLTAIGRSDQERRMILATIGGFWDGNEVWLVTAGAAMFAAFPNWYATLFSGFYPIFILILLTLIGRGIGMKLRDTREDPSWRTFWDRTITASCLGSSLMWGIIVGNLMCGVPIDSSMAYTGNILDLFNPLAITCAVALTLLFTLHGAAFLNIKTSGQLLASLRSCLIPLFLVTLAGAVGFLILCAWLLKGFLSSTVLIPISIAVIALLACGFTLMRLPLAAFFASGITILAVTAAAFAYIYPNVLISSTDPFFNLTIYNSSASPYSLKVLSIIAAIFIPTVLIYQGWTYWILRQRIGHEH